jgi:hypothetical protein
MYPPVNFWKFITSIYYHKLGDFAILLPKISNRQNYQKFTVDFVFYIKKIKGNVENNRQKPKSVINTRDFQILIYRGVKMYVMAQSAFPCEGRGTTNVGDE